MGPNCGLFLTKSPAFQGFFAYFCDSRADLDSLRMLLIMNVLYLYTDRECVRKMGILGGGGGFKNRD
jgi:hypothetical protein